VEHDGGDDVDDNDNDDDINVDVVEDNRTTTMRWPRGRLDDDNAMAMGGQ
jgi:hypothetical protein